MTDTGTLTTENITRRYYLLWMAYSMGSAVMASYYPVFLRSNGLSQLQANSILALSFFIVFVTDIPTGAYADAAGRALAFTCGNLVRSMGWLLYFFAGSFGVFLAAEATSAIGFTLANGALEAWAVDALDASGFVGDKSRVFSREAQLTGLSAMLGAILGAYAAEYSMRLPWLIGSALLMGTALAGSLLMVQKRRALSATVSIVSRVRSQMVAGLSIAGSNKTVLLLAVSSAIQIAAWAPYEMEWQIYFINSMEIRIGTIGLMFCMFKIANALGSEVTVRIRPLRGARERLLGFVTAISGLALFAAGYCIGKPRVVLAFLVASNVGFGFASPLIQTWANEEIDSDYRATLLSFFSTFATAGGAIGLIVGGELVDLLGVGVAWRISGLLVMSSVPFILRAASSSNSRRFSAVSKSSSSD